MSLIDAVQKLAARHDEIEALVAEPEVLSEPARLRALLKERGAIAGKVEAYRAWARTGAELEAARSAIGGLTSPEEVAMFADEVRALEARLAAEYERIRELFVTDDEDAHRDIILEIRAGTGGDEAALFAGDLFRMYCHYADRMHWTIEILDSAEGGMGGFKEVVAEVVGQGVYRHLRYESGGHRVQRVPATESQGRIHTSAATVAVLPQVEEVELEIKDADLRIDTYRSSGPGGQKVNKTSSAIRITHLPTGVVVQCQDEKSQHKNRARAMKILKSRLYEMEVQKRHAERSSKRRELIGSGDRSERIRTYNFPQNRVTDHRINLSLYCLDRVMAGDLAPLIGPLTDYDKEQMLRELEE